MKEKEIKENRLSNILRITALVEAVVIIILSVIAFSTKNVFLFKMLLYIGGITAFFAMSLLFLKFLHIIEPNPIGGIASALLILAIFCTLTVAYSGFPSVVDSFNKSIESLEGLPDFMEAQTDIMNKSVVILEDLPDFMQAQTEAINKSIKTLEEIHDFLIKPELQ